MTPIEVSEMYAQLWQEHGPTHQGVGWATEAEHLVRLYTAAEETLKTAGDISVLDVGCGYGRLLHYLTMPAAHPFHAQGLVTKYLGIDPQHEPLAYIEERNWYNPRDSQLQVRFVRTDVETLAKELSPDARWTAVIAIGTLAWHDYAAATRMLEAMWKLTDFVMVFTVNTKTSVGLTPQNVMGQLKSMGVTHYRMLHDYGIDKDYMFVCRRYKDQVVAG